MRRRRGDLGHRIGWDEALDAPSGAIAEAGPDRSALYLTSRGITNEVYYTAGKAARAMGIAGVDSAARVCHAPSTLGLKQTIGVPPPRSLQDVIESDLVVIWGQPGEQPAGVREVLYPARLRGVPGRRGEPVPRARARPLLGRPTPSPPCWARRCATCTCRCGPAATWPPAPPWKLLIERGAVDRAFVAAHTDGWDDLAADPTPGRDELLDEAGLTRAQVEEFVDEYARPTPPSCCGRWGSPSTAARSTGCGPSSTWGWPGATSAAMGRADAAAGPLGRAGRSGDGGHATVLPGGIEINERTAHELADAWGFPVPDHPGLTAPEMLEAAAAGELCVLWSSGGNFLDVLPDPVAVEAALDRVPLRVHQDILLSSQMLVPGDDVILLPVATRYEQEGGGTETTTERRIVFSPEIPARSARPAASGAVRRRGHQGAARAQGRLRLARQPGAPRGDRRHRAALRRHRAAVATGDGVQWGGHHLCAAGIFSTADGRARFSPVVPPRHEVPEGMFMVATRRGKQFNSMVMAEKDPLTGAGRDAVYIDRDEAASMGLADGDAVVLRSEFGTMAGHLKTVRLPRRSLQVHWPEGNVLLPTGPDHREPGSQVPDYNVLRRSTRADPEDPGARS
jgi:anaerobic selenocysteine-containing dehydrogenase